MLNVLKELKETMSKQLKENMRMTSHQIENTRKVKETQEAKAW